MTPPYSHAEDADSRTTPQWFAICLLLLSLSRSLAAQEDHARLLERAEQELRRIYEQGAYRSPGFQARWLPDSSGYLLPARGGRFVSLQTGETKDLTPAQRATLDRNPRHAPGGGRVVEYRRGDLFVRELASGERVRLTRNARPGTVSNTRAQWSPDGSYLAFVARDLSAVRERYSLVPGDPSYPGLRRTRFARVGGSIPGLRVGIVTASGGAIRWLDLPTPAEGFYLGAVQWTNQPRELLVEWLSRFRNARSFYLANAETGALRRIFHETDPAWVVASYGTNLGLEWIHGGEAFVVLSEQEGWRRAYVYARSGERLRCLTPEKFDILARGPIDHARGYLYFDASPTNATQRYLYRVRLDGKARPERLSPRDQPGTHRYRIAPDGRHAIHEYSRFDRPPRTSLISLPEHRQLRVLRDHPGLITRIARNGARATEFLAVPVGDGIELDGWMMKPPGFDPRKRYPVLVYVYSEPHAQTVLDAWNTSHAHYHRLIADLGYLVVSFDSRGTPAPKGAAWRRAVFGSLGPLSTEEQATALRALARRHSFVDLQRVGIWGWSGGGSNTLNAMFRKPELYQVGIAVAAKPQPRLYNAWFQEIYMRHPQANPEGYARSAPLRYAEGLRGDLLIVHGTGERNTHLQIIEGLVDRLIALGKRFDYMAYPNRRHGLREGKGTAVHLRTLMIRYLLDHLAPGPR